MKVSIVIPAHNAAATLRQCVAACKMQSHKNCEIIVVDDGSADDTAAIARDLGVTVIQQAQRGPAAARNAGARAATGDILAFTDSDCVPRQDWIEHLARPLVNGAVACGGTYGIANPDAPLARLIHREIRLRHARFNGQIDFAGSYNFAIKRDVFLAMDGFDEDFHAASAEDNDLCYRLNQDGHVIHYAPEAIVDHHHPTRIWRYLVTQARHGYWRAKLYAKHPAQKSGDRYAGGIELWIPVIAVGALGMLLLPALGANPRYVGAIILPILIALYLYRFAGVLRMRGDQLRVPLIYAAVVLWLRDFARGIGLLGGVWRFLVLRKAPRRCRASS